MVVIPRDYARTLLEDDSELIPIEAAALEIGIEPKRLRGFIFRNGIADPIGNATHVYRWSLTTLRKRLADQVSEVQP